MTTAYMAMRIKYEKEFFPVKITIHTDIPINSRGLYLGGCLSNPVYHTQAFSKINTSWLFDSENECKNYCAYLNVTP